MNFLNHAGETGVNSAVIRGSPFERRMFAAVLLLFKNKSVVLIIHADGKERSVFRINLFWMSRLHIDFQETVFKGIVKRRSDMYIRNMVFSGGIKVDTAHDSRMPPVILIFDESAVGPFDDKNRDLISAGSDEFRHIEFRGAARIFTHAGCGPVDIGGETGFHAVEVQ